MANQRSVARVAQPRWDRRDSRLDKLRRSLHFSVDQNRFEEPIAPKQTQNIKTFRLTLLVLASVIVVGVKAASISATIANINADANKPGGPEQVLKSISASTHVPVATLEKEKAKSGLSYGDLFIAHSIAKASGKSFEEIVTLKKQGQTWDKIADDNNVSLGGKKSVKNAVANARPTPAPKDHRSSAAPAESAANTYKTMP